MYDLHTHSTCSDGAVPPEKMAIYAKEQGLLGFALTDHDTMRGIETAKNAALPLGIDVIDGCELSAYDPDTGRKVHLLVYMPKFIEALTPMFESVQKSREEACLRSIEVLKKYYPVTEEDARLFADGGTLFRTHIMCALMERGYADRVFGEVYDDIFSKQCGIAHFPVDYTSMEKAALFARESRGFVVLAHPGVYDSFGACRKLCEKGLIDGIESDYPRRTEHDMPLINELVERFSLVKTGGTDFHGFHATPPHPMGTGKTSLETIEIMKELTEKRK